MSAIRRASNANRWAALAQQERYKMTLEEYIEKNYSEKQLNENFSYFSGWHTAILEVVRETWKAAQQSVHPTVATVAPPEVESTTRNSG